MLDITEATKWSDILPDEANDLGKRLYARDLKEREAGATLFPPHNLIFRALNLTPPAATKAIIIGQDPYIRKGQAEGLCFSVAPPTPAPPSLRNIFQELHADLGVPYPTTTSLVPWAKEGVLLLNSSLTVYAGESNSCLSWGWQRFTSTVLETAAELPQPVVYIAWGNYAKNTIANLHLVPYREKETTYPNQKTVISSPHPSPFSANSGFFGSRPFSKTNQALRNMGGEPIQWTLP